MYFESHAHYDDRQYKKDLDELIQNMHKNGVQYIVNIGVNMKSSLESIKLAEKYDFIYATVGVHPHDAKTVRESDYDKLRNWLKNDKVVALGEIGLDYHYDYSPKDVQIDVFKRQLKICEEANKPVVIHSREACGQVFDIIKKSNARGVIHAYSGSLQLAKEYVKLGYLIGVGGVVTFKNAKKLVEVVEQLPLEKILIETDSPYLTPVPFRGQRNDSQKLKYIVGKISEIKQIDAKKVEKICYETAQKFFGIK